MGRPALPDSHTPHGEERTSVEDSMNSDGRNSGESQEHGPEHRGSQGQRDQSAQGNQPAEGVSKEKPPFIVSASAAAAYLGLSLYMFKRVQPLLPVVEDRPNCF